MREWGQVEETERGEAERATDERLEEEREWLRRVEAMKAQVHAQKIRKITSALKIDTDSVKLTMEDDPIVR
eukprot:gene54216-40495_t